MVRRSLIVWLFIFSSCSLPSRTGQKIYSDFFGGPNANCVQVIHFRDTRALDDCCVWLHFKACPQEISRILSQHPYDATLLSKKLINLEFPDTCIIDESLISDDPPRWWSIKKLGNTCLKYEYRQLDKDYIQVAYISTDSTEVYYRDMSW